MPLPPKKVLRTPEQLEGIRASAKINTALLDYISDFVKPGVTTRELDTLIYQFTTDRGAIPAPLGYGDFPKSACISINEVVCHGIPSEFEALEEGDIVNIDVSTIYKSYFSDASRMFMVGKSIFKLFFFTSSLSCGDIIELLSYSVSIS